MKFKPHNYLLTVALAFGVQSTLHAEIATLPAMGADPSQTSVSGLSSGGFMTTQIHTTYSGHFIGAGVLAGGPYFCAGSYDINTFLENAATTCMNPLTQSVGPDGEKLFEKAQQFAEKGLIDDLNNLKNDRVYMFGGAADETVKAFIVGQVKAYYQAAGVPDEQLVFNDKINAGHAILTNNVDDSACDLTQPPYINDCDFFQSHALLKHIYGNLNPPVNTNDLSGHFIKFDQKEFIDSDRSSMSDIAYAYIPEVCNTEACRVHVVLHGCEQGAKVIRNAYYTTTGYNEMADSNHMIVLYPQAQPSATEPYNPKGCWDFWGYTDNYPDKPAFYTKAAPQMKAIIGMIDRLTSEKADSTPEDKPEVTAEIETKTEAETQAETESETKAKTETQAE